MSSNAFLLRRRGGWLGLAILGGMVLGTASAQASSTITRVSSWTYNTNGTLASETTQSGSATGCISTPLTAVTSGDNTCNVTTKYAYDAFGNKIATTVTAPTATGTYTLTTTTNYDSQGKFLQSTTNGLVTNGVAQTESWLYDPRFGVPTQHTGPNGVTTYWSYDNLGRKITESDALGNVASWTYTYGQNVSSLAAYQIGISHHFLSGTGYAQSGPGVSDIYDTLGREIVSETQMCASAQQCTSSNVGTAYVYTNYNGAGQIYQKSTPLFSGGTYYWTTYTYDALGRVAQVQAPYLNASGTTVYGTTGYDYEGLTQTVTDTQGNKTTTTVNAMGLPVSVTNAASATVTYTYDAVGNLLTVTDPKGNVTSYTYDVEGRKIQMVDPDRGTWNYAYDALGELLNTIDGDGHQMIYTYDILGRMIGRAYIWPAPAYSRGSVEVWTYDTLPSGAACTGCIGKLTYETVGTPGAVTVNSRNYSYDAFGRPVGTTTATYVPQTSGSTTELASGSFTTTYSATTGLTNTVTYASGYVVQYNYTNIGTVASLTGTAPGGAGQTLWTLNSSDVGGRTTQETLGNGIVVNNLYDPSTGRLVSTQAGLSSGTQSGDPGSSNVANFSYVYDSLGNLVSRTDSDADTTSTSTAPVPLSEALTYDNLYRLTGDTVSIGSAPRPAINYAYDVLGNITYKSDTSNPAGYVYGAGGGAGPHAVSSITCSGTNSCTTQYNVTSSYTYDADGNMLSGDGYTIGLTAYSKVNSFSKGTETYAYTYDADEQNQLTQQQTISSTLVGTTVYFNDQASGLRSELLISANGTTSGQWTDYLSVGGELVGIHVKPVSGTAYNRFFIRDHLGSVAVVTGDIGCSGVLLGSSSCVLERDSYDAWGRHRNATNWVEDQYGTVGGGQTTRGYTGHEEVQDTGNSHIQLVNANARMYDPTTGKFIFPDPLLPQGGDPADALNPYSYVLNNPLSATDPTGMKCHGWLGCTFGGFGLEILSIAVAVVLEDPEVLDWEQSALGVSGIGSAVIAGAASGAVGSDFSWQGALIGGAEAGGFYEVGTATDGHFGGGGENEAGQNIVEWADDDPEAFDANVIGHGLVGGLASLAGGGSFQSGFLAAGFSDGVGPSLAEGSADNIATEAVVGGIGSVLGGGKFVNGAETGAFGYLFNEELGCAEGGGGGAGCLTKEEKFLQDVVDPARELMPDNGDLPGAGMMLSWQAYEQANGSVQTPMTTSFNGENVNVILDLPPMDSEVVDFKDYNWSSPGYSSPFLQQRVIGNFQNQIQLYQTIRPNVILQFSQQPPQWVIDGINQVGGGYRVSP